MSSKFGPQTGPIHTFVEECRQLNRDQAQKLVTAWLKDIHQAQLERALQQVRRARRSEWFEANTTLMLALADPGGWAARPCYDVVTALVVGDLISRQDFDALTDPWRTGLGKELKWSHHGG